MPDISSIKEGLSKPEKKSQDNKLNIGLDPVTIEQLRVEWNKFAEKLKKEGRDREFSTLNQRVEFKEDLSIKLTLPNSFQSLTIEGLQQELLTYLRTNLNNGKVKLVTEIEKIEDKKMIYTNSEKFEFLADKYPDLRDLRTRLELDTDF